MATIRIDLRHNHNDWSDAYLGETLLCRSTTPALDAARALLARGLATEEDTLTTYRGEMPCISGKVGPLSQLRIDGIHFWKPKAGVVTSAVTIADKLTMEQPCPISKTGRSEATLAI